VVVAKIVVASVGDCALRCWAPVDRPDLMNLAVLKKSRRSPQVGDVFVLQPPDGLYLFGRVIDIAAEIGPFKSCVLVYLYRQRSSQKAPPPALLRGQLLVPPLMTNRLPWSRGYFELVESRPLTDMDRLPQHCFADLWGRYFDERSRRLPGPVEPIGQWGLESYRTIDDQVSEALGIPLAPDD